MQPEAGSGIPLLLESVSRVKVLTDNVDFHMGSLRRSERTQLDDSPCSNVVQPPETIPGRQEERKTTSRRDASPRPPVPGERFGSRRRSNVTVGDLLASHGSVIQRPARLRTPSGRERIIFSTSNTQRTSSRLLCGPRPRSRGAEETRALPHFLGKRLSLREGPVRESSASMRM